MPLRKLKSDEAELLEVLMGVGDEGSPLAGAPEEPAGTLLREGLIRRDGAGNFHITDSGRDTLLHSG